jgi:hypothetical protein
MANIQTFAGRHRLRDRADDLYETPSVATIATARPHGDGAD